MFGDRVAVSNVSDLQLVTSRRDSWAPEIESIAADTYLRLAKTTMTSSSDDVDEGYGEENSRTFSHQAVVTDWFFWHFDRF